MSARGLFGFIGKRWELLFFAALLTGILIKQHTIERRDATIATMDARILEERHNHLATQANFRLAMARAKAENLANVLRIERDRSAITERSDHETQTDLAALRSRYDEWLRSHAATSPTAGRVARHAQAPALPIATSQPVRAAAEARSVSLGADERGRVSIDPAVALRLSEDAVRHDQLIDWVIAQAWVAQEGDVAR